MHPLDGAYERVKRAGKHLTYLNRRINIFRQVAIDTAVDNNYLDFLKNRPISLVNRVSWTDEYLTKKLGADFDIIRPRMPLKDYARYEDWKIHFERYIPLLDNNVVLVGSSLGGIFLARYLSEHKFPKKILATYLVCPPYDNSMPGEDLVGGFKLKADLSLLQKNAKRLNLLFSLDDDVVPTAHADKFRKKLPDANIQILENMRGHFGVSEFPLIVKMIKEDVKSLKKK